MKTEKVFWFIIFLLVAGAFYLAYKSNVNREDFNPPVEETPAEKPDKNLELMHQPCFNEDNIPVPCKG